MGEKLFPPILDTKLPAFAVKKIVDQSSQNTVATEKMAIPFQMNKAVALGDVSKMSLIIKTAQTGKKIDVLESAGQPTENPQGFTAVFDCSRSNLEVGQYYKVQLAYINLDGEVGYYSQAGIIKKTSEPTLEILELKDNSSITNRFEYTGHYKQNGDASEKVYSYCFTIKDLQGNIISTSGECLHNSSKDDSNNESYDTWINNADLIYDESYKFSYKIKTVNGYEAERTYLVTTTESVNIDLDINLESKLNYEDGLIELYLSPNTKKNSIVTGDFVLVRSSSLTDFKIWDPIEEFHYTNVELSKKVPLLLWEDYLVEQGETYRYAIQAYNINRLYSNRLEATNGKIQANFEYCFLSDAEHQLKIKFNPKVTSLKSTILESKVNTLGSKYPFIFKNGYVDYKEFPISGLLSLVSDENGKFNIKYKQESSERWITPSLGCDTPDYYTLNDNNIYSERQFKIEVLNWLNNGSPKLFRSPTEGNYIVRLMNSSLAPNDALGRMLHTFNTTACEIAECNFSNIKSLGLIKPPQSRSSTIRIGQIIPENVISEPVNYPKITLDGNKISFSAYNVSIVDAEPGTIFKLEFYNHDPQTIEIGGTGTYIVPIAKSLNENISFESITLERGYWRNTKINFEYYEEKASSFNKICNIITKDEIRRFVGYDYNVNLVQDTSNITNNFNCVLSDIKRDLGKFHFIRVEKRYVQDMWKITPSDGSPIFYSRTEIPGTDVIQDDQWNPLIIYHEMSEDRYFDGSIDKEMATPDYRFQLNDQQSYSYLGINPTDDNPKRKFSQSFGRIDSIRNVDQVTSLRVGSGLMVDVGYRVKIKEYDIEKDKKFQKSEVYKNYNNAKKAITKFLKEDNEKGISYNTYPNLIKQLNTCYKSYINALKNELARQEGGIK